MKTSTRGTAWLHPLPLLAVLLWGGIYPGAKLALDDLPVVSFTALRLVLAAPILFLASWYVRPIALPRHLYKPLLNAGLAQTIFQLLLVTSLRWTTAGNSAILLATAPLLTALWFLLAKRDAPAGRQWLGLGLGLVGVVLIVGGGVRVGRGQILGDLLALGSAAAWAWYGLAIGPLVRALGALRATAWTMLLGAIVFVPLALPQLWTQAWSRVSWEAWAGVIYGATVGMVVAMALWGRSISRLGPRQTMLCAYLEPVSAVVVAALVLGEAFSPQQGLGALLAFAGVWLAS
jgi:drug/metabolite transporter (DMT)-like permease